MASLSGSNYAYHRFTQLLDVLGKPMTFFVLCAMCDMPYNAEIVNNSKTWSDYLTNLRIEEISHAHFTDGVTDVDQIVPSAEVNLSYWKQVWGEGSEQAPYTEQDYRRMDYLFKTYSARLVAAGGYDEIQEDTLRSCSRQRLQADKYLESGTPEGIKMFATLSKTIQDALSSENLRKKDAKPVESARVDGIVEAMQKKYGVSMSMTKDQFFEVFHNWQRSHRYPETVDAAEKALLDIMNTTRNNNDLPEYTELPQGTGFSKQSIEFASDANQQELAVFRYLGITNKQEEELNSKD